MIFFLEHLEKNVTELCGRITLLKSVASSKAFGRNHLSSENKYYFNVDQPLQENLKPLTLAAV